MKQMKYPSKLSLSVRAAQALFTQAEFKSGNTKVEVFRYPDDEVTTVLSVHGNEIATLDTNDGLMITDAGWQTRTTSARLNALPGVSMKGGKLNGELWDGEWIGVEYLGSDVDKLVVMK